MHWLEIIKNAFTFYMVTRAPWAFQDLGLNLFIVLSLNQRILKHLTCSQATTWKDARTQFWGIKGQRAFCQQRTIGTHQTLILGHFSSFLNSYGVSLNLHVKTGIGKTMPSHSGEFFLTLSGITHKNGHQLLALWKIEYSKKLGDLTRPSSKVISILKFSKHRVQGLGWVSTPHPNWRAKIQLCCVMKLCLPGSSRDRFPSAADRVPHVRVQLACTLTSERGGGAGAGLA